MRAGRLRHRVTLYTVDPSTGAEFDFATLWAGVEPARGREMFEGRQERSEVTGLVVTRFIAGVKPWMRIRFGTRRLEILSVADPDERHRELQLAVRELAV